MFRTFRIPAIVPVLCLVAFFVPLFLLPFFNHPSADDYICGIHLRREGLLHYQSFIYQNWGGRYTATFTGSLFAEHSFLYANYYLHTILLLLLDVCSLYFLLSQVCATIFKEKYSATLIFLTSLLLTALECMVTAEPATYLFWFSSAITYHLPVVLLTLELGLWLMLYRAQQPAIKRILSVLIVLLIAAINGYNELFIIAQAYLIIALLLSGVLKRHKVYLLTIVLPVFLLSASMVVFAPGSSSRASLLVSKSITTGVAVTLFQTAEVLWNICKSFLLWVCTAGVFLLSNQTKERLLLSRSFQLLIGKSSLLFFGIILFVISSVSLAVVGLRGGMVPDRYLNAVIVITLFLFLVFSFTVGVSVKKMELPVSPVSLSSLFFITLSVGIVANDFFKEEYQSLISAPVYNQLMNERETVLKQSAGKDSVVIDAYDIALQKTMTEPYKSSSATVSAWINQKPSFLFYTDDLGNEYGRGVLADFYGIKTISVKP